MSERLFRTTGATVLALALSQGAQAQDISTAVQQQMTAISTVKAGFNAAQKKMGSKLVLGIMAGTNDFRVAAFRNAIQPIGGTDLVTPSGSHAFTSSAAKVQIKGVASPALAAAIVSAGGTVVDQSARWGITIASLPLGSIESIAARPDVKSVRLPPSASTNVGAVTSQGYVAHQSNTVVNTLGITGTGVTVGVLSDSASPARVAALIASGDLPADTRVLPGQDGPDYGEDEGAAMMEIVHDVAPGAKLIFATAYDTELNFANNILALAAAGCKVIVDDVSYFDEPAFQDGIVAQAVNQVTAQGIIYFSSAANSGSLTKGTSGTWEGDFRSGGVGIEGPMSQVHNFGGTSSPQNYDALTASTAFVFVHWSDPVGASANDYDLFILSPDGTQIYALSDDTQDGTGDPIEGVQAPSGLPGGVFPVGSRVVVVKYSGATRALHIDTERGALQIATSGATFGHNAALNTVSMAATYWNSAKTGVRAFTGFANTNETFSSDGPRKIFYDLNGVAITPGNLLFATNGGRTLQKPDLAAADGVSTHTPGFLPFFGTSAAAPHAAGIAALVRSARPTYTVAQTKAAMTSTALDSMEVGVDRDSGYGIAMSNAAVQYALSH